METFYILGKDERFSALIEMLDTRFPVYLRAPCPNEKGTVIFPMLVNDEKTQNVLFSLHSGFYAVGGRFTDEQKKYFADNKIGYTELLKNSYYIRINAEETAEAALSEIIRNTKESLSRMTCLVIGYGNCGKAIARILFLAGCLVYVNSHENSMKRAEDDGFNIFDIKSKRIKMFDFIVNTAEGNIFPESVLDEIFPDTPIFQIATGECVTEENRKKYEPNIIHLGGLPAKYSPLTDAEAIYQTLINERR